MEYKSEEEFLKNYDSSCFEKLSCTTDIALFSVSNEIDTNYRKLSHKFYSVLLVKRKNYPFKDKWCLPGGFIRIDEDLEDAPKRILKEETNIDDVYLEQLYTFGDVNRDPRMRIISTSYIGLIDKNNLNIKLNENTSWFKIDFEESDDKITINFDNDIDRFSVALKKILKEKTTNKYPKDPIIRLCLKVPFALLSRIARPDKNISKAIKYCNNFIFFLSFSQEEEVSTKSLLIKIQFRCSLNLNHIHLVVKTLNPFPYFLN